MAVAAVDVPSSSFPYGAVSRIRPRVASTGLTVQNVSAPVGDEQNATEETTSAEFESLTGVEHLQGTRGFTVLGHAPGELAIWGVTTSGQRGWAAVEHGGIEPERARALLGVIERTALVGLARDADLSALERLAVGAGAQLPSDIEDTWLDVFGMFEDVAVVRAELAEAGGALSYNRALPEALGDLEQTLADLRLVPPKPESAAARQALGVCMLLGAAVALWDDTEAARVRRKKLHTHGGPRARVVPDRWHSALSRAYRTPFHS